MSYTHGIRKNWQQFIIQLLVVFAIGLTIGSERTVVPVLGREAFALESILMIGSFVLSFGFVKALLNLYGGKWADEYGRKPILILGWILALPIPVILVAAPNWWWVTLGNVLLGINQGLAWSMSVNAKIDLAGDEARGVAVGLDEALGYGGVAIGGWVTGIIATSYGLRPAPFYLLGAIIVSGLFASVFLVEETKPYADAEAAATADSEGELPFSNVLKHATYGNRTLFAASQAGSIEKFVDALVWIVYPLYFTSQGLSVAQVGIVVGVYGGVWGVVQLYTGRLADRIGRRSPVVAGMFTAGLGTLLVAMVDGYMLWLVSAAVTGLGMALLYPNLITVVGDAVHPQWRAQGLGVYRMWRDAGYGFGAIFVGLVADLVSVEAAIVGVGIAMLGSWFVTVVWLEETHPALVSDSDSDTTKNRINMAEIHEE
ncbi:MFS transporter [Halocatena marina]|uniref:MFS transporter n=1 Tax=Halocatena marina TaxID=2934937 RepID=UPI0020108F85|nr:MFS transporter [Halocatena marina]